jgi:hypothetical protein
VVPIASDFSSGQKGRHNGCRGSKSHGAGHAENHSSGPKGRHCKNHTGNHFPKAPDFPQEKQMEEKEAVNSRNLSVNLQNPNPQRKHGTVLR